jgi:hypothetical protein
MRARQIGSTRDGQVCPGREVYAELVLGEPAAWSGRQRRLDHRREPLLVEPGQVGPVL